MGKSHPQTPTHHVQAMARDLKLNFKQYTSAHIKRRCERLLLDNETNGTPAEREIKRDAAAQDSEDDDSEDDDSEDDDSGAEETR